MFFLGMVFLPLTKWIERKLHSDVHRKKLLAELADYRCYLEDSFYSFFNLLTKLNVEKRNGQITKQPYPLMTEYNFKYIEDFLKESFLDLSSDERAGIKSLISASTSINNLYEDLRYEIESKHFYNERSLRCIIRLICTSHHTISNLMQPNYKRANDYNSLDAGIFIPLTLGASWEDIEFNDMERTISKLIDYQSGSVGAHSLEE